MGEYKMPQFAAALNDFQLRSKLRVTFSLASRPTRRSPAANSDALAPHVVHSTAPKSKHQRRADRMPAPSPAENPNQRRHIGPAFYHRATGGSHAAGLLRPT